jgi:hypothetical protein
MATKVYAVTAGCYSDYHIEGIFSTRERAEKFHASVEDSDKLIEEYTLDARIDWVARDAWATTMYIADGRISEPFHHQCEYGEMAPPNVKLRSVHHTCIEQTGGNSLDWVEVQSYVSQAHADKVAAEIRQAILRERFTNPDYQYPSFFALEDKQ